MLRHGATRGAHAAAARASQRGALLGGALRVGCWMASRSTVKSAHIGAYLATCHSGVTLAANHALVLPPLIDAGKLAGKSRRIERTPVPCFDGSQTGRAAPDHRDRRRRVPAQDGDSVAAAMLASGHAVRARRRYRAPRAGRFVSWASASIASSASTASAVGSLHGRGAPGHAHRDRTRQAGLRRMSAELREALRRRGGQRGTGGPRGREFMRARRARCRPARRAGASRRTNLSRHHRWQLAPDGVLGRDHWTDARSCAGARQRRPLRAEREMWALREGEVRSRLRAAGV